MGRTNYHIQEKAELKAIIQRSNIITILKVKDTGNISWEDQSGVTRSHPCAWDFVLESLHELDNIELHFGNLRKETIQWYTCELKKQPTEAKSNTFHDLLLFLSNTYLPAHAQYNEVINTLNTEKEWFLDTVPGIFKYHQLTHLNSARNIPEIALIEKLSSLNGLKEQFTEWISALRELVGYHILQINEETFSVDVCMLYSDTLGNKPVPSTEQTLQLRDHLIALLNEFEQHRDLSQLEKELKAYGAGGLEKVKDIQHLLNQFENRLQFNHPFKELLDVHISTLKAFLTPLKNNLSEASTDLPDNHVSIHKAIPKPSKNKPTVASDWIKISPNNQESRKKIKDIIDRYQIHHRLFEDETHSETFYKALTAQNVSTFIGITFKLETGIIVLANLFDELKKTGVLKTLTDKKVLETLYILGKNDTRITPQTLQTTRSKAKQR